MLANILFRGLLICLLLTPAYAQHPILSPNDAVVTGFSQTEKPSNTIDLNGPSLRIFSLPSSGSYGLVNQPMKFSVKAKEIGQVFGVALDDAEVPNIYVAATSAYGIAIFKAGKGKIEHGAPGAHYAPGLFGPSDQGGESTSIWRIDGKTGAVSLFANVSYHGIENMPASLGALAFDASSRQLFVSDRTTGMIHRFSLDGKDRGVYDHGVEGLTYAGQTTYPFDPSKLSNIKNSSFDAQNANTWGFAPIERRVFALAVHQNRLYYSVSGSQIWSVGIAEDGSFAKNARFEIDTGTNAPDQEISSIAFDSNGWLYVAERGFPIGDIAHSTNNGKNRVMRFAPKDNSWNSVGDEYAIGMSSNYQHANGGVDVSCEKNIWMTGDNLISSISGLQGNPDSFVKPENTPPQKSWFINFYDSKTNSQNHVGAISIWKVCNGKTTTTTAEVVASTPAVVPEHYTPPSFDIPCHHCHHACPDCCLWAGPWGPWGFDCGFGWCGSWGIGPWGLGPWWGAIWNPKPLIMVDPAWGGGFGIDPWWGGGWVDPWFGIDPWWGDWIVDPWFSHCGFCIPCIDLPLLWCPGILVGDHCFCPLFPFAIMNDHLKIKTAPIHCKHNEHLVNGKCVPDSACKPNEKLINGKCIPSITCKPGEKLIHGNCVPEPITCRSDERLVNGKCVPIPITCKPNERLINGKCETIPPISCKRNERFVDGKCVPIYCKPNERLINGKCIQYPICGPSERLINGKCMPIINCKPNERLVHGRCVPIIVCKPGERLIRGKCVPSVICKPNERLIHGKCVPNRICKPNERLVHGRCVPVLTCKPYERLINGKCVPVKICKPYERLINGRCVPVTQPNTQTPIRRTTPILYQKQNTTTQPNSR